MNMPRQSTSHTQLLNGEHSLTDCSDYRTSEALVDSREQVIQDILNDINSVDSNNAINFFTLLAGSNGKGSSDILSNNTTSFTLSAAATSLTLTVTLQAVTSFRVSAIATSPTLLAAATSSTLPAAAMSFPLSVSNFCNKGPLEAKIKCARKTDSIKLKTKQLKQRKEKIAEDRVYSVSQLQNPTLLRHNCTIRGDETQYIIPNDNPVYSSRAVTYLLEIAVARGQNKVYLT
jgi:hypothetical protein